MRWVVRIEREDDGSESDVIRVERSRMEDAAGLGLTLEAKLALAEARRLNPQLTIRSFPVSPPMVITDGLRKAGVPEE